MTNAAWPPDGAAEPELWMVAEDVFHIKDRGTVVTGTLRGAGLLTVGDVLACDGQQWPVSRLQQGSNPLTVAEPDSVIGVLLANGPVADVLRGKTVEFLPALAQLSDRKADRRLRRWRR